MESEKKRVKEIDLPVVDNLSQNPYIRGIVGGQSSLIPLALFATSTEYPYVDFIPQSLYPAWKEGRVFYSPDDYALVVYNSISNTSMQLGFEVWVLVRNRTGSTINDGKAVYISGSTGQTPEISLASKSSCTADCVIGLTTSDISNQGFGFVTVIGNVNNINTNHLTQGAPFYLDSSGDYVSAKPTDNAIKLGICIYKHSVNGKVFVQVDDSNEYQKKFISVSNVTLTQANWSLVSGLYEYSYSNANITSASLVDVTPKNTTIDIVIAAQILPQGDTSAGAAKFYAKNAPTGDISVDLVIWL